MTSSILSLLTGSVVSPDASGQPLSVALSRGVQDEKRSTIWSVIVQAQGTGPEARRALGRLIERYQGLVLSIIRSCRQPPGYAAEDLAQDFFEKIVRRGDVHKLDPAEGRFRNWLHTAVRNFMKNVWAHYYAKRSGESVTGAVEFEVQHGVDPERLFMRRFADMTVQLALDEQRSKARDKERFARLSRFLPGPQLDPTALAEEAAQLGISSNHLAVQLFQMRDKFRRALREIVADTLAVDVTCPEGAKLIDVELGALYRLLTEVPADEVVLGDA